MTNKIDLTLLEPIQNKPLFMAIEDSLMAKLSVLPQTKNRLLCCLKFSWFITDKSLFSKEERDVYREGFFRAALAEYAATEETLKRDVSNLPNNPAAMLIRNISHPLPHLLKELRNLETHIVSSTISSNEINGYVKFGLEEPQEQTWTNYIVDGFDKQAFEYSTNSKYYNLNDVDIAIQWFNTVQHVFGIDEVIRLGVKTMAENLVSEYEI